MTTLDIDVGKDFSRFPGGRVPADGPYSGARFREEFLIPALKNNDQVNVIIDGVMGYGSSFLEECFGGLVRQGLEPKYLRQKLKLVYSKEAFQDYVEEIWEYIESQKTK